MQSAWTPGRGTRSPRVCSPPSPDLTFPGGTLNLACLGESVPAECVYVQMCFQISPFLLFTKPFNSSQMEEKEREI